MTIERRIIVGLPDIKAIVLECIGCGARLSIPPDSVRELPNQCQHCNRAWSIDNTSDYQSKRSPVRNFAEAIEIIRRIMQRTGSGLGVRILMEFDETAQ